VLRICSCVNEFLIDCSSKSYSMASKFDRLIQRYAILIPRYASTARDHTHSFKSRRIRNKIRKYFTAWIRGLDGIVWWKYESKNLRGQCNETFYPRYFHQNTPIMGLHKNKAPFRIWIRISARLFESLICIILHWHRWPFDTACKIKKSRDA
jgi:hypothetical protein